MVSFKSILLFAGLTMAAPALESEKSITKRFNGGWCGVHVHLRDGNKNKMDVQVYDGAQQLVWTANGIKGDGTLMVKSEGLPAELNVNAFGGGHYATFTYGDQAWNSEEEPRCALGNRDDHMPWFSDPYWTIDMDCGFSC